MTKLFFHHALLPTGWARNVSIACDAAGLITSVEAGTQGSSASGSIVVPGMANLHSHAFQRAMAGLAEWRSEQGRDSFWSWREVMYRFLERLRPEDVQAIAAQLYIEMLEAGFTAVGEFHYLHQQPNAEPYDNPAELSERIAQAAQETGIGLTLLPVLYQQGGFGGAPLNVAQQRFYCSNDGFLQMVEACQRIAKSMPHCVVGIAPHSLRAVSPESLKLVVETFPQLPVHIHVAEQDKEVRDCIVWSGKRPVQWLYEHHAVNERWCLIHATHLSDAEIARVAASKAVVSLCPITEASLGDGVFEGIAYREQQGRWGIGSDSHIRIDVAEELRSYEYSQRLRDRARNLLVDAARSTGRALLDAALAGGAQGLSQKMGRIEVGQWCDLVALDAQHPLLVGKQDDDWLNSWIFSGDSRCVRDVWAAGKHLVKDGRHIARAAAEGPFAATMQYLMR